MVEVVLLLEGVGDMETFRDAANAEDAAAAVDVDSDFTPQEEDVQPRAAAVLLGLIFLPLPLN